MFDPSTVFQRSSRQVSCDLNGETAILNLDEAVYFGLQGVGAEIWTALETPQSLADLNRVVCAAFDVDPARCEVDIVKFLAQMQAAGLVERVQNEKNGLG